MTNNFIGHSLNISFSNEALPSIPFIQGQCHFYLSHFYQIKPQKHSCSLFLSLFARLESLDDDQKSMFLCLIHIYRTKINLHVRHQEIHDR